MLTIVACGLGAALLYASWRRYVETDLQEALGFVTGAACVWLGVKQNVWNWPLGIANNAFYVVVFFGSRLYADASLQIAFAVLGAYGWYAWTARSGRGEQLAVSRTPPATRMVTGIAAAVATAALTAYLSRIADSAPFLDALTTALSLAAQYLMTCKYVECWWVWIAVDVISIGLYAYKHLELTAVLYAVFMAMCVVGLRRWRAALLDREISLAHA